MARWEEEKHQPEPWIHDGRSILSAGQWRLAKTVLLPDARRIVAAVNDTQGIPTPALEAGFIRDLLELKIWPRTVLTISELPRLLAVDAAEYFIHDRAEAAEPFPYDRRAGERRRGDRRRNPTR